jgi:hypothetical protein
MDRATEHEPGGEMLRPAPATEPPPAPPKRRHTVRTVLITVIATIVVLAAIGFLMETRSGEVFAEDFESGPVAFSTDSDRRVDLSVEDGAYRIEIKDASGPQLTRHVFTHSYDGLSFEATVVHPDVVRGEAFASIGCWTGESAYLFVAAPNGRVGLVETISESRGERRGLTDLISVEGMRPAGQPNRLRIECVGGRDGGPTTVSGYVNDEPAVSIEIDDGYDSFDAIGFFIAASTDGATFTADDVVVRAERPDPGLSPVPDLP